MTQLVINQQELDMLEQISREVCSKCLGSGSTSIELNIEWAKYCNCNGSGLKWEGLSRECPCIDGFKRAVVDHQCGPLNDYQMPCSECEESQPNREWMTRVGAPWEHSKECNRYACQGSGRVPVSVAEAVLWIQSHRNFRTLSYTCFHGWFYEVRWYLPKTITTTKGNTPALALFAAMREVK